MPRTMRRCLSVTQTGLPAAFKSQQQQADWVRLLWCRVPVGSGARRTGFLSPGQVRLTEGRHSTRQQRDMRLRYCSTSGTRHCGEPLCSRKGCSSRSVALARSRGSRVSMRSRKSFRTGEIWNERDKNTGFSLTKWLFSSMIFFFYASGVSKRLCCCWVLPWLIVDPVHVNHKMLRPGFSSFPCVESFRWYHSNGILANQQLLSAVNMNDWQWSWRKYKSK